MVDDFYILLSNKSDLCENDIINCNHTNQMTLKTIHSIMTSIHLWLQSIHDFNPFMTSYSFVSVVFISERKVIINFSIRKLTESLTYSHTPAQRHFYDSPIFVAVVAVVGGGVGVGVVIVETVGQSKAQ